MVKVRSVRTTSSRIVVELEKSTFKQSAKEKKLIKFAKEAIDQLGKSYDELETKIKRLEGDVKELMTHRGRLDIENLELKKQIAEASLACDTPGCFENEISKTKLWAIDTLLKKLGAGPSLVRTSKGVYGCVTNSPGIMSRRSKTIAAGIVHYSTEPMSAKEKRDFCKVSGVSAISINKMTNMIRDHLSSSIHR
jgi:hypothetical protein